MKSKALLFIGIILLVIGILIKKLTPFDSLGLASIIIGVTFKSIYIFSKAKSGEYKPERACFFNPWVNVIFHRLVLPKCKSNSCRTHLFNRLWNYF